MAAPRDPDLSPEDIEVLFRQHFGDLKGALLSLEPQDGRRFQIKFWPQPLTGKLLYFCEARLGTPQEQADHALERPGFRLSYVIEASGRHSGFGMTDQRHGRFMLSSRSAETAAEMLPHVITCIHHIIKDQASAFDTRLAAGPQMHRAKQAATMVAPAFSFKPKR